MLDAGGSQFASEKVWADCKLLNPANRSGLKWGPKMPQESDGMFSQLVWGKIKYQSRGLSTSSVSDLAKWNMEVFVCCNDIYNTWSVSLTSHKSSHTFRKVNSKNIQSFSEWIEIVEILKWIQEASCWH